LPTGRPKLDHETLTSYCTTITLQLPRRKSHATTAGRMVELIPPPEPHNLLPPLLACLPTAFASRQPPPALLSLLSPILRQRLTLISPTSSSNTDNWLRLLCWDNEKAGRLKDVVENGIYEPHPVSGEIEVGDVGTIKYKRFDQETLRSQVPLPDWSLTAIYLWCAGEEAGNNWKLAELLPYEGDTVLDDSWSMSISDANESSHERIMSEALRDAEAADRKVSVGGDDDYWAMYDRTPANRTPAVKRSPALNTEAPIFRSRFGSEDYYAQYGDVQPAMDNHDPDEQVEDPRHSSLNGNALEAVLSQRSEQHTSEPDPPAYQALGEERDLDGDAVIVNQPRPTSPGSVTASDTIERLERTADRQAASEVGIRQHISTSMKSMFRLAKSAGMDREEFERMINRELETLSLLDNDD